MSERWEYGFTMLMKEIFREENFEMKAIKFKPCCAELRTSEAPNIAPEVLSVSASVSEEGIVKINTTTFSKYATYTLGVGFDGNVELGAHNGGSGSLDSLTGSIISLDIEYEYIHMILTQLKHEDIILLIPNRILEDC